MQQQQQANKHSKLHQEDQHITLEELWKGWKSSEGEMDTIHDCVFLFLACFLTAFCLSISS